MAPRPQPRSAIKPTIWHPRTPADTPDRCPEAGCGRRVGRRNRAKGADSILPEPDCCRYCARPLTAEAIAAAPRDGFILAAMVADRRPATWSANAGDE